MACYHTAHMRPRGFSEAMLVVLAATILTIALTYPVAFGIDRLGRVNTDDGRWSIWVVAWVAHALTTNPLTVYDANIFYPHRYALAFSEANFGAGVLGAPVWLATQNPFTTHNVVFLFTFILSFCATYYLVRYLTQCRIAALIAAMLFAFCPFIYARTAHIQLLFIGTLPLCMLAFHRLVDAPSVKRAVMLGVVLWATALSCAYYGIFAGLMVGLGTIVVAGSRGLWRSRDYWIGIALAAFISISLTLPFFLPYMYVQREMGFARTVADAQQYSADFDSWLASAAWAHGWLLSRLDTPVDVLFPGIMTLLLGIAGAAWLLRRNRELVVLYGSIAVLAFWSSFGPDAGLYRVFYEAIPIFTFLRAPGRMGVMTTLSLVVLAAAIIPEILQRAGRRYFAGALIGTLALADVTQVPLRQFREVEPVSAVYQMLAELPWGPVVELPYWYQRPDFPRHAYYMLKSTTHWKPLVNGYSDHIPADFRERVLQLSSFPTRDSFAILGRIGARYVVFHVNMYDSRNRARLMERLHTYSEYLRPLAKEGDVWLYEIVGWPN